MRETKDQLQIPAWFEVFADMRADAYVLLGSLLTKAPSPDQLSLVQSLSWQEELPMSMQEALTELVKAAESCSQASIAREYHRIFVGLGRGELVPYGSWYIEKMIQSVSLARIRSALARLDIIRQPESFESEDHAGALCEIMALLSIPENKVSEKEQTIFFNDNVGSWMGRFFMDLQQVKEASFYPMVGVFGQCFLKAESEYLGFVSGS